MKKKVKETYIANMSAYSHLLSEDEIVKEIRKVREYNSDKSKHAYHKRNKIKVINKAMNTLNKI